MQDHNLRLSQMINCTDCKVMSHGDTLSMVHLNGHLKHGSHLC